MRHISLLVVPVAAAVGIALALLVAGPAQSLSSSSSQAVRFHSGQYKINEPATGTNQALIQVDRGPGTNGRVGVDYTVSDGTATNPADYTVPDPSRQLVFEPGDTSQTIAIDVPNGPTPSPKTVILNLQAPYVCADDAVTYRATTTTDDSPSTSPCNEPESPPMCASRRAKSGARGCERRRSARQVAAPARCDTSTVSTRAALRGEAPTPIPPPPTPTLGSPSCTTLTITEPPPPATSGSSPTPTTTTAPSTDPTPPVTITDIPPATVPDQGAVKGIQVRSCVSRRKFGIRVQVPHGSTLLGAEIQLEGKAIRVIQTDRLRSSIDLRGLPQGTFTVVVHLKTKTGKRYDDSRTYKTCRKKIPHKPAKPKPLP